VEVSESPLACMMVGWDNVMLNILFTSNGLGNIYLKQYFQEFSVSTGHGSPCNHFFKCWCVGGLWIESAVQWLSDLIPFSICLIVMCCSCLLALLHWLQTGFSF